MSANPSTSTSAKIHSYHRHGDIEFRSKDGMILMADSWRIAKASKVFADMLEMSTAQGETAEIPSKRKHPDPPKPIEIDYTSSVISHFIDLANQAHPSPPRSTYEDSKALYEFCDQFDVDKWRKDVIKERLGQLAVCAPHRFGREETKNQWDLLLYAGEKNDVELGRKALAKMDTSTFFVAGASHSERLLHSGMGRNPHFWGHLRSLPDSWQADLLYRLCKGPIQEEGSDTWTMEIKNVYWDSLGEEDWDPKHESPW